ARGRGRRARYTGRRAARSRYLGLLARAGFAARGVLYAIIGCLAVGMAFGHSSDQADSAGAVRLVAATPVGLIALWLLLAGFAGLALWRLSEAAYGGPGPGEHKPSSRLAALGKAVVYGVLAFTIAKYAIGAGAPKSGNQQSADLTASVLHHPGGQVVVVVVGLAFVAGGGYVACSSWRRDFLEQLNLAGASQRSRRIARWLGQVGGIARGAVFAAVGVFLIVAGVKSQPDQAKGIDSALRVFAQTPLGPWLLVVVAAGLVTFGLYSWCEARWRKVS
ncbi:MAG: DUF1206 domain-containing protein, partial [Streptosporangiaceae bacterium]